MGGWNRGTPWRQGHVFTDKAASELGLVGANALGDSAVIVVSHGCDLLQPIEKEPFVEVIVGRTIATINGTFTNSKNPRRLHLAFQKKGAPMYVEIQAKDKQSLRKETIADYSPDANVILSPKNLRVLQEWLAARYHRTAFPDEFERRLREAHLHERIPKIFEPYGEHLVSILVDLDEGQTIERDAGDPYTVRIYILYYTDKDPQAAEKAAREAADTTFEEFRRCCFDQAEGWKNFELLSCEPISDMAMPYATSTQLLKLNLEYISLRAED